MQFIQAINALLVERAAAAALAVPAASGDGVSLATWKKHATPIGYSLAAIGLYGDGAGTVQNAALYAFGPYGAGGASKWMFVAYLNNGLDIALTATAGFIQQIELPTVFSELAVAGTIIGGINVGYTATPVALHGGAS